MAVPLRQVPTNNQFSFGRSLFDGIPPGTPQILEAGSNWGKIKSVANRNCLDLELGTNYPVTTNCTVINDTTTEQAWHYSTGKQLKYFDGDMEHSLDDYFMCLYAFGDKEDNTGFVRVKQCPGSYNVDPDMFDNAQWEPMLNPADPYEFKLRNLSVDMCLGEAVTQVKAGKAGKPGPARVRTTWALVDCDRGPWWNFLHLFEDYKIDEKLCKVGGDANACIRYKNRNRKVPIGLTGSNYLSADYVAPFDRTPSGDEYGDDYEPMTEEEYAQYMAMYEYYMTGDFKPYDYEGYGS